MEDILLDQGGAEQAEWTRAERSGAVWLDGPRSVLLHSRAVSELSCSTPGLFPSRDVPQWRFITTELFALNKFPSSLHPTGDFC